MDAALAQKSDDRPSLSNERAHNGDEFSLEFPKRDRKTFIPGIAERSDHDTRCGRSRTSRAARIAYAASFFEN
jgi:hypothetical protein